MIERRSRFAAYSTSETQMHWRRVGTVLMALSLNFNLGLSAFADPSAGNGTIDLNLSSSGRTVLAPASLGSGSVAIKSGTATMQVTGQTLLTPAEHLAVSQIVSNGAQSIKLSSVGTAVGGSFNINSAFNSAINNLVIPNGVTSVSNAANLNILGNLNNSGVLQISPALNAAANINASNIINNAGALIKSTSALSLTAANNIINYGQIVGANSLSFTAGNSIVNSSSSSSALSGVISAANNVNLSAANITNSGSITAASGNINISSMIANNILFNNTNGLLSALNGDINVRDELFTGKYHFNLFGGDVLSNNLNIWSANGNADLSVNNISSRINVSAANIHVLANTADLKLGTMTFLEDPTFFNAGGNILVDSAITTSSNNIVPGVAIVAKGNVTSSAAGSINTGDTGSGNGFPVIVVAGANFTTNPSTAASSTNTSTQGNPAGQGDTTSVLTLLGPSSTGGSIDLSLLTSFTTAGASGKGGSVTLAAFAGTAAGSGTVKTGDISTSAGVNTLANGNITIIAGAKPVPATGITAITTGNLITDTTGAPSGGVLLVTGTPLISGGQFQILNGQVIGQNFALDSASLGTVSINPGASISTKAISTNVAPITILAGSNVTLDGSISTNGVTASAGTVPGPGGNVTVIAGGNITGAIQSISTEGKTGNTVSYSNAGGDILLAAGAKSQVSIIHTFNTQSFTGDTLNVNLTLSGASPSGGSISLADLGNLNAKAGITQVNAPVNNQATGGNVSVIAFAGATAPATTGLISLPGNAVPFGYIEILTGGSPAGLQGFSADTTISTDTITVSDTTGLQDAILNGVSVTGPGIPTSTTISSFTPFVPPAATTITLNNKASATATGVALVAGTPISATNSANGSVIIIAGGQPGVGTSSITLGDPTTVVNVDTSGSTEGGGNITILTASPTGGLPFFYSYNSSNAISATKSGSFTAAGKALTGDIIVNGNLTAVGGTNQVNGSLTLTTDITVKAGGNLSTGIISNTNNTLPAGGPPGALSSSSITLEAGATMSITGPISSNAGPAIANVSGADGGTINLKAAAYAFPNGQQTISADGSNGYTPISSPLNFNGTLTNASKTVTDVFTTIDGVGLVAGTIINDNAGNAFVPAGTRLEQILVQGTQANGDILNAGQGTVSQVITAGLVVGQEITGGSIPAGSTIATISPAASVTFSGDTTSGSNIITNVPFADFANLVAGQVVAGPGIPTGATIDTFDSGLLTVTLSTTGNATATATGVTVFQAGQITLNNPAGFANVAAGALVMSIANGQIMLSNAALQNGAGTALTDQLPIGQSGGNGGNITIRTSTAQPITVDNINFKISALGGLAGGNGGTLNLISGAGISIDPTHITTEALVNNLANAGFGTLITTGTGPTFNLTAASTLFISGSLDASGAPSTLNGTSGTPGGNGGVINIDVNSALPFNIGGATAGGNGLATGGILSANGNGVAGAGVTSGFGSAGSINIINRNTAAASGIIVQNGAIQVQAAVANDPPNTGAAQQTYTGGSGGNIILKGQTVASLGSLDANGGSRGSVGGSGDGGSIRIESNSATAFTVDPGSTVPVNGVQGTLSAAGNLIPLAATQSTILATLPSGNGGSIILKNSGGNIVLAAGAGMSVAASNADSVRGTLGGNGGTIELDANGSVQSAIGLNVNGGLQLAPAPYSGPATLSSGNDVAIVLSSGNTDGLFVGQTVTVQDGTSAEGVLIKSVDSSTQITVFQVVNTYSAATTLQTYFAGGNGGKISISTNSKSQLLINPTTGTSNSVNGILSANGFNGGFISVSNKGSAGIAVAASSISAAAIATPAGVGSTLVGAGGTGGNISIQAPAGPVSINGNGTGVALNVNGATIGGSQTVGPNFGGLGGNIFITSNSTTQFTVGASTVTPPFPTPVNGVNGSLSANGGAGVGGNGGAGSVTIVNLGTGGILVNALTSANNISLQPGVKSDGSIGSVGPAGNGGSLTLTAPKGPVFVAGSSGINVNGNVSGEHAPGFADGLGGSVSITSSSTTAFNIGAGSKNGTAGPITANGWSGGSISITNLGTGGIVVNNAALSVTAQAASQGVTRKADIAHLFGGPGGNISLQAPKGIVSITGGLDVSGGAQFVGIDATDYVLPGGNAGQIAILTGKSGSAFNIGGATAGGNGSTGALTANGQTGGIVSVNAVNGADIIVASKASISVAGFPGASCSSCNADLPIPDSASLPGGNSGGIYLQATGTGGFVFVSGTAATGGLSAAGGSASAGSYSGSITAGPFDGNGGKIIIVSNSTTAFNLGAAATNTNGLGSGGSSLVASGYNGGTIGVKNLAGGLTFNPSLINVSSAKGSVAGASDLPGGNGGIIDLQAPKGKLGASIQGTLSANATPSVNGQLSASGGTITLGALQIDESLASLSLSAAGAQSNGFTGNGGTIIVSQTTSTAAQALVVGQSTALNINVSGSPGANLGGTISLHSPAGINVSGNLSSDSGSSGTINLSASGKNTISQSSGTTIKTGTLNLLVGDGGSGASGLVTTVDNISARSSGKLTISNTGDLTLSSVYMSKALDLNVSTSQGSMVVGSVLSPGNVKLAASGIATLFGNSGNITINGNLVAANATLQASSGDGLTGGLISGSGLVSADSIKLSSDLSGAFLNTSTGLLTVNCNFCFAVVVNNTGNLLLSMGTSQNVGALVINNIGSITTTGNINMVGGITLDNVPGLVINGSLVAGSNVLNTSSIASLQPGAPLQGVGLPAGTTVGAIGGSVFFTGNTEANSNIVFDLTINGSVGSIAPGAQVDSPALPAGTTITRVVPLSNLGGAASTTNLFSLINNVPAGVETGVLITKTGTLPANTTVVSEVPAFNYTGNLNNGDAFITGVSDTFVTSGQLQPGVEVNGLGLAAGTTVTSIGAPVAGLVQVNLSNSSTNPTPVSGFATPNYVNISQAATASTTGGFTIPNQMFVSAPASSTGTGDSFNQLPFVTLSNAATVTIAGASLKQLASSTSGNSNSITLGGTVGAGAIDNIASVTINAGGSIVQTSGQISANSILLSSMNGNVGMVTRAFNASNVYTPGGTALNLDVVPDNLTPGTLAILSTNAIDGSSPGTVNVAINPSTSNPTGVAIIEAIDAGGDVLVSTNQTANNLGLLLSGPVSSTYGAITILNSSSTEGSINIGANMTAAGGPLTIQNNNNSASAVNSINLLSSSANPITLSGVGWFLNGLAGTNVVNSASTTTTTVPGQQTGVALITGQFPAPPLVSAGNPGNITANTAGASVVTFGSNGNVTSGTPNTVINATGASVVFQGANGAIQLGDSGIINASSSALVISSLDLSDASVVANLSTLQTTGGSGLTGSLTTSGGTLNFDPTTATIPFSLANLSEMNITSKAVVTFNNFTANNPVAVNVIQSATSKNSTVSGNLSFANTAANTLSSDGHIFFNSNIVGQVLSVAGTMGSNNNLTVNAGGSVTLTGTMSASSTGTGAVGTLGLFTGQANPAATSFTATTVPAGTLTMTSGDLAAGLSTDAGNIQVNAASINSTGTSSIKAANVELSVGGKNWKPVGILVLQTAASKISGIPTISAASLAISAASGASISLTGTDGFNVGSLSLNVANSPVSIKQKPAIAIAAQSLSFTGGISAGSSVLNTGNTSSLLVGTLVQGIGLPADTTISSINSEVGFTGDIGANGNVITNVPETTPLVQGGLVSGVGIPNGTVISEIAPPSGGFVVVTLLLPGTAVSTAPLAIGASFQQAPYVGLSNPAEITRANGSFQDFVYPGTLNTLSVTSTLDTTGGISTSGNISCSTCTFQAITITNLNTISTNSPAGKVNISPPTGLNLSIVQTDGVRSGSILASDGISILSGTNLTLIGGTYSTARGTLSVKESGLGNLTITGSSMTAGTFNGTPLGPTILPTDIASTGTVSIQELGTGSLTINDSASLRSIGNNVAISSASGSLVMQGLFQADGGNVVILNSGTTTSASGSVFIANALGTTASNSVGGIVEISAGTNLSQVSSLSTVPGTLPSSPLFMQPAGGPPMPLGGNVAINNNASGSSAFPTGAIMQSTSGTNAVLNAGNSNTAQTSLNLFGGGIIFSVKSGSLLINDSIFEVNGYTPLAATTSSGNSLEIEMDDPAVSDKQAIAHVFTPGHKQAHVLTTHGFVEAGLRANLKAPKDSSEFRLRSGEMLLNPLSQTTIHAGLADIKVKKGALLAVSTEESGLRVTSCSGPGHVTVVIGEKTIALSAGEELILSDHELSSEEQYKADGIGRRHFSSYKLKSGLHASICEVSLFSLLSSWEALASARSAQAAAEQSDAHAVARSVSDRILKTSAALTMLTQSRGAYQANAKKPVHSNAPSFIPVNFTSSTRTKLRASAN